MSSACTGALPVLRSVRTLAPLGGLAVDGCCHPAIFLLTKPVFSFTPVYEGQQREVEVGVLYNKDPAVANHVRLWGAQGSQKIWMMMSRCKRRFKGRETERSEDMKGLNACLMLFSSCCLRSTRLATMSQP